MNVFLADLFRRWYNKNSRLWHTPEEYFDRPNNLLEILKKWNIKSIFDAGCGHRHWVQHVQFAQNGISYSGGDVSDLVVQYCNQTWPDLDIVHHDISTDPLPKVDMIFCNDVLIHLNNQDKLKFLKNFLSSQSMFLMMTHSGDYPLVIKNLEIDYQKGFPWAPVNWNLAPWNFPAELDCLPDNNHIHKLNSKRVSLWDKNQIQSIINQVIV